MIWGIVKGLAGDILGGFLDHFKNKQELKRAIELAKIERVNKLDTADIEWDQIMAKNSEGSWKDEWVTLCVTTLVFGIPTVSWVFAVWDSPATAMEMLPLLYSAIDGVPDWLKATNAVVVAGSFGYRKFADKFPTKKKEGGS